MLNYSRHVGCTPHPERNSAFCLGIDVAANSRFIKPGQSVAGLAQAAIDENAQLLHHSTASPLSTCE